MPELQSASDVLMIRPVRFMGNPQTSSSNAFQQLAALSNEEAQQLALAEFDAVANALINAGVGVHVFDDTQEPHTPDSIFPNNWVSFHADGTVVLYPMLAPNRRAERRMDVLQALSIEHGFHVSQIVDLTHPERDGKFLEGTGSVVLDRLNHIAYACLSSRTNLDVLGEFAQRLDYDIVTFEASDLSGTPIYHTNVLMCVGTQFAAVCFECIQPAAREAVRNQLQASDRAIVELGYDQMLAFAGNMLELRTGSGGAIVAMSSRARDSLTVEQQHAIELHAGPICAVPIPTIESLGGGSVRCMLAELNVPRKAGRRA